MPLDLPKCDICEQNDVQITCIRCENNFCKVCDEKHHSKGKLKEHQRDNYSGLGVSRFCTIRGHEKQLLSLFCQTCSKLICGMCVVGDHKPHTWVLPEVAAEHAKGALRSAIVPLQEKIRKVDAEIKTTQGEVRVLQGEIKKKENKIQEGKKEIDETLQRIEEIKSLLSKNQVDSFTLLSVVSNLKLEINIVAPLALWLNKSFDTWKLLYKWTTHQKTGAEWHSRCDGKGPTVTIIWANGGYVFGGYTPRPWTSSGCYEELKGSFLFSLTDGKDRKPYQCFPSSRPSISSQLLIGGTSCFLNFGGDKDLYLVIPPPEHNLPQSHSNLGIRYQVPEGFSGSTFLAGSKYNWTIEEIETYLV